MKSYGLTPTTVTAVTDKGAPVTLTLSEPSTSGSSPPLPTAEVDPAKVALYIMDRFGVSDEAYHELTQVYTCNSCVLHKNITYKMQLVPELPRLHRVKDLRKDLNTSVNTIRLPAPYNGYYLHVKSAISSALASLVSHIVYLCTYCEVGLQVKQMQLQSNTVLLKLSGDGASFSATTQFVFLTFSFPEISSDVLAASGIKYYSIRIT